MPEKTDQPSQKIYYDPFSVARRTQQLIYRVQQHDKNAMLEMIIKNTSATSMVVITKSKRRADALYAYLQAQEIKAIAIHGNHRAQEQKAAVASYHSGEVDVLISTDMILQTLELNTINYIVSYDLPLEPKQYFTRVGYLKEQGVALSLLSEDEEKTLSVIEYLMKSEIVEEELIGFVPTQINNDAPTPSKKDKRQKPRHRSQKQKKKTQPKDISKAE